MLYDFPADLQTVTLKKNLTFYTQPYIDIYQENTVNPDDPLYNFNNKFLSMNAPVYCSGRQINYMQSEDQFYRIYPKISTSMTIGAGDGGTMLYTGTLTTTPFLRNSVIFSSIDANYAATIVVDKPSYNPTTGLPYDTGDLIEPNFPSTDRGDINYVTGTYSVTFAAPPASGQPITVQTIQYNMGQPQAMLFYNNQMVIRPVPDKTYAINIEVSQRPTEMLSVTDSPEVAGWFQYIAYGTAIKILNLRMDQESVQTLMPEFKHQEFLVLSKSAKLRSNQRADTIYAGQAEEMGGMNMPGWRY
jgi:hypothetical protein